MRALRSLCCFLALLIAGLIFGGCGAESVSKTVYALGTVCNMTIYGDEKLLDNAEQMLYDIDARMSWRRDTSEVSSINAGAGSFVKVSKDTFDVIKTACDISAKTDGAIDITSGILTKEWNISEDPHVPDKATIANGLKYIDYKKVELDEKNSSVKIAKGQFIDVGAVAKGFAADKIAAMLEEAGVDSGVLNLGGNVYIIGKKPDGSEYRIGLRDPEGAEGSYFAAAAVDGGYSVVVSGAYERNFTENGVTYHHILDPKTGYPSKSGLKSSIVVAKTSAVADALSTAVFVLGEEKGLAAVEKTGEAEAMVITADNKLAVTSGFYDVCRVTLSKDCKYAEES